jgi:hypothetical protein
VFEIPSLKPPTRHAPPVPQILSSLLSEAFLLIFVLTERINTTLLVSVDRPSLKAGLTRTVSAVILLRLLLLDLILLLSRLLFGLPL